ncbi:acyltransferase domain-containing protein [Streptomyces sp. NPDC050516]|uniref:acyltransferase domain-containing protein n=1 Tax=Streptomyces sp. NPDC050516 TaxID=3365621 RepID=UPI0037A03821
MFVFPGQGAQWVGMGRQLMCESAEFTAVIDECAAALEGYVDWSLPDVLWGGGPGMESEPRKGSRGGAEPRGASQPVYPQAGSRWAIC